MTCDDIWLWSVTVFMWCWFKFEFKSFLNKKFGPIVDVDQIHDVLDYHNTLLLCFQTMQSMTEINTNPWRFNSVQQMYDVRYMTDFSYVMDSWLWCIFGNLWPNPSSCKSTNSCSKLMDPNMACFVWKNGISLVGTSNFRENMEHQRKLRLLGGGPVTYCFKCKALTTTTTQSNLWLSDIFFFLLYSRCWIL